jgi:hypothetical protein
LRTRVLVLVLLALLLAGVGVWQWPCRSSAVAPPAPAAAIQSSDADTLFAWHAVHSFGEARAMLRDAYRLTPDRRFLLAVADVPRLAGDRAPGEVATRWDGARWVVTCGADSVGVLPGYPSYADARALLAPWAARWRSAGEANPPAAAGEAPSPVPDDLFTALVALDARWRGGERGAAVQAAGAEALGWLVLANAGDCTRQSDVLAGRMLAALSLANAAGTAMPRAHVLLARVCGYPHEAAALAATLPAGDPRRAWAQRDTAALTRLALAKGAGAEARLMHLYALAEDGRSDAWFGALMECFPPGALASALRSRPASCCGPSRAPRPWRAGPRSRPRWKRSVGPAPTRAP